MAINRNTLHCLLALCIGLLPVLNVSAMSVEHSTTAPMECLDCGPVDMHHGDSCQDRGCTSITQSCQANTAASYLPATAVFDSSPIGRARNHGRSDALAPHDITDAIYRPPIT